MPSGSLRCCRFGPGRGSWVAGTVLTTLTARAEPPIMYIMSSQECGGPRSNGRRFPRTGGRTFRLKSGKKTADELGMSCAKLMPGPPPQPEASGKSVPEETCRSEDGFTRIELMVVLLILAILLAIAIPTFLGVTKSANDRAAQSNLNTAMLNAKAAYQSNSQTYTGVSVATLSSAEPSLSFIAGASTGQGVISVNATDGHAIVLAAFSKSNNCWYQIDNPSGSFQTVAAPFTATAASVTGSGSNSPMASPTNPSAGSIFFPTVPGTVYVEVKGDSTTADCNALTPAYHGTSYQWTTTGFPSI